LTGDSCAEEFAWVYNAHHQRAFFIPKARPSMTPSPHQITQLLKDWGNGDQAARDQLMVLVYEELRRMAHQHMRRERAGHTLQTSALVHEAFMRLVGQTDVQWQNRAQFFGIAAQMMRRVLVDHARSRQYTKRGGDARRVSLDEVAIVSEERAASVVALDDALTSLAIVDQRKSQLVELRFFGGLSVDETATVLAVSPAQSCASGRWPKPGYGEK
jgi:RNA polymerase sigma-70 factor, ECF subfamily